MQEKIFTFIEQETMGQRFIKVASESYQDFKTNPKQFFSNFLAKDPNLSKQRQYIKVGLAGAMFCWLLMIVIYVGIYFYSPAQEVEETVQSQKLIMFVALPPTVKPKSTMTKASNKSGGGGGGGSYSMTPPSKGKLPKAVFENPIVSPSVKPPEIKNPVLPVLPTIKVQPELIEAQNKNLSFGIPNATNDLPSAGPGSGGGIGTNRGGAVGDGIGYGYGPGIGDNTGGGPSRIGDNKVYNASKSIVNPVITYKQKPKYTTEGQRDKIQGSVILSAILSKDGTISELKVVRGLGYGLDEEAIKAAYKIKFLPGRKNDQPINVRVRLEFVFQLL
ncbi:MAG: energy transducer TonB [Blastocatellia bacterium]